VAEIKVKGRGIDLFRVFDTYSQNCWVIGEWGVPLRTYMFLYIFVPTAIGLTPVGSCTVHIYTQRVHRTTQLTTLVGRLSGIRTQSGQNKINRVNIIA